MISNYWDDSSGHGQLEVFAIDKYVSFLGNLDSEKILKIDLQLQKSVDC